jgi:hypothetical protein
MTRTRKRVPVPKTLDEVVRQFREIADWATALVETHTPDALGRRPAPNAWSAAECLEHLNMSADPYLAVWDRELQQRQGVARTSSQSSLYEMDLWGRILYWTLEPPPRFRFPTKAGFIPAQTQIPETAFSRQWLQGVLTSFLDRQQRIIQTIESFRGLPIDHIKITSPFEARVRYTIWSSFCVTAAHERRHLWQAERALAADRD